MVSFSSFGWRPGSLARSDNNQRLAKCVLANQA